MNINFSNNFSGNIGVGRETIGPKVDGASRAAQSPTTSGASRLASNLTIGEEPAGIASAEPVSEVPESALDRDDALGKLVNSAFCLPAPPMPNFAG